MSKPSVHPHTPRNNRLIAILVAVLVLFAQYGASLHMLSHAVQDVAASGQAAPDKQAPGDHDICEQCIAFAAAAAAPVSNHTFALATFAHASNTVVPFTPVLRRTTTAYHSRAPPPVLA